MSPKNPNRSRWLRRALFAIGLAGIVYLGFLFVLSRFLDPETLAASLEPRMEAALAREVQIGRAEVGFFPLGMRLQDVSVADPTGLAPVLARIESIEFQVDLLPLLRKEVRVRRLILESPEANLRVGADGRSNFGDFSADPSQRSQDEDPGAAEAFALELRGIRLSGGRISFVNEEDSTTTTLDSLQLRATVHREAAGPWIFVGDTEGKVSFEMGGATPGAIGIPVALSFDILAGPSFEEVEIRSGSLGVDPVALALVGKIGKLKEPLRTVSMSLKGERLPLSGLVEALPDHLRSSLPGEANGTVAVDLRIEGDLGPGTRPEISGTARLVGGSLSRDGARLVRAMIADFSLASGGVVRVRADGEVLDGPFSLEGQGELGGERNVDVELEAYPDLALVESLVALPEGVSTEGRLKTDVRITGSASDPRSLRFWGEVSPNQLRMTTPSVGVPITFMEGVISLQGNTATFRDIPISLDQDQLMATGVIRGFTSFGEAGGRVEAHASIRGPKLDLRRLSTKPPPDPALSYGKVAFARVGGRLVAGRSVEDAARELRLLRPDSIPMAGALTLALDTVIGAKGRMEDLRAVVEFGPDFLRVSDLNFRQYGGSLQTSMNLLLGENAEQPFSMGLVVEDLDAGEFLGVTSPLGEVFRGRLSLNMELVGSLDSLLLPHSSSLVGSGGFSLTEGGLNSILITESLAAFLGRSELREPEIQDWASSFVLENGLVRLADATLGGAPGEPRVGGAVGLDGGLDLLSVFSLPSDGLSSFARENLGLEEEMAARAANQPEVVQAAIRIGGSIHGPELIADPEYAAQTITRAVGEEIQLEAQEQIEEQTSRLRDRASGFLRGLTQRQEAEDTLRPDSIRPDTVPPDTLRPDTIKPDTVPPDTVSSGTDRPGGVRTQSQSEGSLGGGVLWRGSATMSQGAPRNSNSNQFSKASHPRSSGQRERSGAQLQRAVSKKRK